MKKELIDYYNTASNTGEVRDDDNPVFLFNMTNSKLLGMIVKGEIDPMKMAMRELAMRGADVDGNWIGFSKASDNYEKVYGEKP